MFNEVTEAVLFLLQLIRRNEKFDRSQLECFGRCLIQLLIERYKNHWFPDEPFKGQAYRCIRINGQNRNDESLENAARAAGMKYNDLPLPFELTLWIDPNEVCYRFGENMGSCCTLASFNDKKNIRSNLRIRDKDANKENRRAKVLVKTKKSSNLSGDVLQQGKPKLLSYANQHQRLNSNTGRKLRLRCPKYNFNENYSLLSPFSGMDHDTY